MKLSGILARGHESRSMSLCVRKDYPTGFWHLRLTDGHYTVLALFDGVAAGDKLRKRGWNKDAYTIGFKRKRDALAWTHVHGFALGDTVAVHARVTCDPHNATE